MRWTMLGIGMLIVAGLQSSLFASSVLWGVRPDLVLILVVTMALLRGPVAGAVAGLIGGMMIDLSVGYLIGLGAVTKAAVGFTVGHYRRRVFWDNPFIPIAFVLAAGGLDHLVYFVGSRVFGVTYVHWKMLVGGGIAAAVMTSLAAMVFYPLFKKSVVLAEEWVGSKEGGALGTPATGRPFGPRLPTNQRF